LIFFSNYYDIDAQSEPRTPKTSLRGCKLNELHFFYANFFYPIFSNLRDFLKTYKNEICLPNALYCAKHDTTMYICKYVHHAVTLVLWILNSDLTSASLIILIKFDQVLLRMIDLRTFNETTNSRLFSLDRRNKTLFTVQESSSLILLLHSSRRI
jgi:hypothetical protein